MYKHSSGVLLLPIERLIFMIPRQAASDGSPAISSDGDPTRKHLLDIVLIRYSSPFTASIVFSARILFF